MINKIKKFFLTTFIVSCAAAAVVLSACSERLYNVSDFIDGADSLIVARSVTSDYNGLIEDKQAISEITAHFQNVAVTVGTPDEWDISDAALIETADGVYLIVYGNGGVSLTVDGSEYCSAEGAADYSAIYAIICEYTMY